MSRDKFVRLANNCKKSMIAIQVPCPEGPVIEVNLSIGLTCSNASDGSLDVIVSRADKLLYRAKQNGRKQVQTDFYAAVETEMM